MSFLKVKNVTKSFGETSVLNGINFELNANEQCALVGSSGSGKSTLLYLIGGLETPDQGEVIFEGKSLANLSDEQLAIYRNQSVGFVFQFHFLLPSLNCLDNILLPAKIAGHSAESFKKQAYELASFLGVESCLKKWPYQISGGEQQRVNIIRSLTLRPKLLLCDEPTGNLDSHNTQKVTQTLKKLAREMQASLIVVTHDDYVAGAFEKQFKVTDGLLQ